MDVEHTVESARLWYGGTALGGHDPLAVMALIIAVVIVILLFRINARLSLFRAAGTIERIGGNIQDVRLRLDDFIGRFSGHLTRLEEESKQLRGMVSKLQVQAREAPLPPTAPPTPGKKTSAAFRGTTASSLAAGLSATREGFLSRLKGLFNRPDISVETLFSQLEEVLLKSDLGVKTTEKLLAPLKKNAGGTVSESEVFSSLKASITQILDDERKATIQPVTADGKPYVILVVGVNGVGKTTTIAKLALQFKKQGKAVLLAGCDTFRAAATEQLESWAERAGVAIISGTDEEKPTTVCYRAMHQAVEGSYDVVLIDTAGRMHTRLNLMNELKAVLHIISREQPGAPHDTLLVVDASTGQNALQQAREFHQAVTLSGIIVTKLDGTQKGGIVVGIKDELSLPIRYIGIGEGIEDLRPFSAREYTEALFSDDKVPLPFSSKVSEHARIRRARKEEAAPSTVISED